MDLNLWESRNESSVSALAHSFSAGMGLKAVKSAGPRKERDLGFSGTGGGTRFFWPSLHACFRLAFVSSNRWILCFTETKHSCSSSSVSDAVASCLVAGSTREKERNGKNYVSQWYRRSLNIEKYKARTKWLLCQCSTRVRFAWEKKKKKVKIFCLYPDLNNSH